MPCDGYGSGSVTFEDLDEGTYSFQVRASTGWEPGVAARRVFVIDRTAPTVTVTSPGDGSSLGRGRGRIDMVADELGASFTCALDGGDAAACEPGQALPQLAPGAHTLAIVAEDAAGNRSAAATTRFTVPAPDVSVPAPVTETPAARDARRRPPAPAAPPAPATPLRARAATWRAWPWRALPGSPRSASAAAGCAPRGRSGCGSSSAPARAPGSRSSPSGRAAASWWRPGRCASVPARACASTSASPARRAGALAAGRYAVTVRLANAGGRRGNALSRVLRVMPG